MASLHHRHRKVAGGMLDAARMAARPEEACHRAELLRVCLPAQVKAERVVRSSTFAALQKESLEVLREAAIFEAYCAECEPVSYFTGAPARQRKGWKPLQWFRHGR